MPWKEWPVSEQRLVLVSRVLHCHHSLSSVARELGVSRKTAYKWIRRHREDPLAKLEDRSRRPHRSPAQHGAGGAGGAGGSRSASLGSAQDSSCALGSRAADAVGSHHRGDSQASRSRRHPGGSAGGGVNTLRAFGAQPAVATGSQRVHRDRPPQVHAAGGAG